MPFWHTHSLPPLHSYGTHLTTVFRCTLFPRLSGPSVNPVHPWAQHPSPRPALTHLRRLGGVTALPGSTEGRLRAESFRQEWGPGCLQKVTHLGLAVVVVGALGPLPGSESSASMADKLCGLRQVTYHLPSLQCSHLWNKHPSLRATGKVKWDNTCNTFSKATGMEDVTNK